jgi:hypothetical protein
VIPPTQQDYPAAGAGLDRRAALSHLLEPMVTISAWISLMWRTASQSAAFAIITFLRRVVAGGWRCSHRPEIQRHA